MPFIVKNTTIIHPLDILAPHSCRGCGAIGSPLCERCKKYILSSRSIVCPNCKQPKTSVSCPNCPNLPNIHYIGAKNYLLSQLISDYKYNSLRALSTNFAELLNIILPNYTHLHILMPLPTISRHIRSRGLDHTWLIAKKLARLRPNQIKAKKYLVRQANTVQVGASQTIRKAQADNAYKISPNFHLDPRVSYMLFDDVWTTGSSIKAAIKILQQAGVSLSHIEVVLLAYSEIS